jgi:hypothetical protein
MSLNPPQLHQLILPEAEQWLHRYVPSVLRQIQQQERRCLRNGNPALHIQYYKTVLPVLARAYQEMGIRGATAERLGEEAVAAFAEKAISESQFREICDTVSRLMPPPLPEGEKGISRQQLLQLVDTNEICKTYSRILGGEVVVVGSEQVWDKAQQQYPNLPVVLARECLLLSRSKQPQTLWTIRQLFDGQLVDNIGSV